MESRKRMAVAVRADGRLVTVGMPHDDRSPGNLLSRLATWLRSLISR